MCVCTYAHVRAFFCRRLLLKAVAPAYIVCIHVVVCIYMHHIRVHCDSHTVSDMHVCVYTFAHVRCTAHLLRVSESECVCVCVFHGFNVTCVCVCVIVYVRGRE